uniref:Uncharacterized protein n=1 Tax=Solanum lycopersicum TaxID=4081 RepID=A0A3Q7IKV8_SOLLC
MALLIFTATTPSVLLSSQSSSTSQASAFPASLSSRFCNNHFTLTPKSYANGYIQAPFIFQRRGALIATAAADIDSVGSDNPEPSPEKKEESVPAMYDRLEVLAERWLQLDGLHSLLFLSL